MGAYVGHEPGQTIRSAFRFVALDGQQTFQGRDASGNVLNYTKGAATIVAVAGAILSPNAYTANDGSTLVLAAPVAAGRDVLVLVDAPWSPADTYTRNAAEALFARPRNRIIDPGMRVSQETGGALLTLANGLIVYPSDSMYLYRGGATGNGTVQRIQQMTPGGSPYRHRLTVTAVNGSPAGGDILSFHTNIEGLDIADLKFGTAAAKTVVLRVGIRASVAGNYALALRNIAPSATRSFVGTISVAANEVGQDLLRFLVIPGDVAGTWNTDNTGAMQVRLTLCAGSDFVAPAGASWQAGNYLKLAQHTNLMAVNGATFDLFDVGLYDASDLQSGTAPAFVLQDYADDLRKTQRYYATFLVNARNYAQVAGQNFDAHVAFPVMMRAAPTAILVTAGARANIAAAYTPVVVPTGAQSARFNIVASATGDFYALAETWALNARL